MWWTILLSAFEGNYWKRPLNSRNCLQNQEAKKRSPYTSAGVVVVDVVVTVAVVIVVVVVVVLVFVVAAAAAAVVLLLSSWGLLQLPCAHMGLKQREQTKHCEKGISLDFCGSLACRPADKSVDTDTVDPTSENPVLVLNRRIDLFNCFCAAKGGSLEWFHSTVLGGYEQLALRRAFKGVVAVESQCLFTALLFDCCHALPLALEMIIRYYKALQTKWI